MPTKEIRNLKAAEQGGRCYYCNHAAWSKRPKRFAAKHRLTDKQTKWFQQTAEHLIARCDGGTNSAKNIVMACYYCNSRRHRFCKPLNPADYRKHVRKRLRSGRWHGFVSS